MLIHGLAPLYLADKTYIYDLAGIWQSNWAVTSHSSQAHTVQVEFSRATGEWNGLTWTEVWHWWGRQQRQHWLWGECSSGLLTRFLYNIVISWHRDQSWPKLDVMPWCSSDAGYRLFRETHTIPIADKVSSKKHKLYVISQQAVRNPIHLAVWVIPS